MAAVVLAAATMITTMATVGAAPAPARVAPRAPASATATPSSGLADGQTIDVSATGLSANAPVVVAQCAVAPVPDPAQCDAVNFADALSSATGSLDVSYTVRVAFATGAGGLVDCRAVACEILVVDLGGPSAGFSHAPIAFAPGGPAPAVTATPSTGLAHQQTVAVHGTGFTGPQPIIGVLECAAADEAAACTLLSGSITIVPAADGSFDASVAVLRTIRRFDGTRLDCATTACELVAFDINAPSYNARAAIAFDPTLPPPPAAAVTVTPSTGLAFNAPVTVSGSAWAPQDFVEIMECGVEATDPCSFTASTVAFVDASGAFSASLTVHRMITDPLSGGPPLDCASAPGRCVVVAFDIFTGDMAQMPISFDPNAPIPPPPLVKTSATRGIGDRQPIRFEASRLTPNSPVDLSLCASNENSESCIGLVGYPLAMTNAAGRFNTTVIAHRFFASAFEPEQPGRAQVRSRAAALAAFLARPGTAQRRVAAQRFAAQAPRGPWTWRRSATPRSSFDCASARVECTITLSAPADDFTATVPFSIDARKPPGERASVTVTPSRGLRDNTPVVVTTTSTSYGAFIGQCALDGDLILACGDGTALAPDRAGRARGTVVVRRRLPSFGGGEPVDCRTRRCAILYVPGLGSNDVLRVPISFRA